MSIKRREFLAGSIASAAAFQASPEWQKMKNDPAYKDTVSNITNLILRPCAGSQV